LTKKGGKEGCRRLRKEKTSKTPHHWANSEKRDKKRPAKGGSAGGEFQMSSHLIALEGSLTGGERKHSKGNIIASKRRKPSRGGGGGATDRVS